MGGLPINDDGIPLHHLLSPYLAPEPTPPLPVSFSPLQLAFYEQHSKERICVRAALARANAGQLAIGPESARSAPNCRGANYSVPYSQGNSKLKHLQQVAARALQFRCESCQPGMSCNACAEPVWRNLLAAYGVGSPSGSDEWRWCMRAAFKPVRATLGARPLGSPQL